MSNDLMHWFHANNVRNGTRISFVYGGGSNPGTRRAVEFIAMHEGGLRDGSRAFRARHGDTVKLYSIAKVRDIGIVDEDSNSDAGEGSGDEREDLRADLVAYNRALKRQLEQATVEIEALKRARAEITTEVSKILTALQD